MSKQPSRMIQTEIDIPAFVEQRRLLDATKFDMHERNGVGKQLLKSILNRIGSMRECIESQATLASHFDVTRETINLAINRLTALDLVTKERVWNVRYGLVLNHYRVNWTELSRRLNQPLIEPDQCEVLPDTNVRFHPRPMLGFTPDQCEVSPNTNVRFHPDRNRRTNKPGITTTSEEWKPVVVSLDEIGVSQIGQAIAKAKERGDSPEDVLCIIERTKADPRHQGKELAGIVKNQICNPSKAQPPVIRSKPKPEREAIRTRLFKEMEKSGLAGKDINNDDLERMTEHRLQEALSKWNKTYSPQVSGAGK